MIKPAIGLPVLYFKSQAAQPLSALISRVWHDQMVDVMGFSEDGAPFSATSRRLIQPGEPLPHQGHYVVWPDTMISLITQAARHAVVPAAPSTATATAEAKPQAAIKGCRALTDAEIGLMNDITTVAVGVGALVARLEAMAKSGDAIDLRWVALSKADLQRGFMGITRAVAKPTTF